MAGDSANVRVWLGADVYTAPLGTTAPTDVSTAWGAGWEALGLLSEDGLTITPQNDEAEYYEWSGGHIRTVRSRFRRSFGVTALEDNDVVFHLVNPGSTSATATGITTREIMTPEANIRMFGFELRDGDITKRIVVPRAEVVNTEPFTAGPSNMAMYALSITAYQVNNLFYRTISDDPAETVSA